MNTHEVLRMWVRPAEGAPMEERRTLRLVEGEGVEGDHGRGGKRHVTLLLADDWAAALRTLGRDVDPSARRANVLLSGADAESLLGRTLRIGDVEIEVGGITRPCHVMDEAAAGLQEALRPGALAGVWGRIRRGGELHRGDKSLHSGYSEGVRQADKGSVA